MAADSHEDLMAVAGMGNLGVGKVDEQVRCIVLKVFPLYDTFHIPGISILADGELVYPSTRKNFLTGVFDVLGNRVLQKTLDKGMRCAFLTNIHAEIPLCVCRYAV